MKIALCLECPLAQHGGVEVLVTELVRGLAARHHQVLLVSPDDTDSLARSPVAPLLAGHIAWLTEPATAARGSELAAQLQAAKPDLVHFHLGHNYGWKARAFYRCPIIHVARTGIPCLSTNHGAFSLFESYCWEKRSFLIKLALFLPAWLSKQYVLTHLVSEVAVSQNDFQNLRRWYPALRKKFRWAYHSRLREDVPPPFNPARSKIILCAGTIGPRKGQPYLAEAFRRLAPKFPDWRLVFVGRMGDGTMAAEIRNLIARYGLEKQIILAGACSDDDLRQQMKAVAVFAMPSIWEGLGLSLQEAQFYGCACVATRCGGTTDLIQDGDNGLLVPACDPEALATALEKLMGDEKLRERFSRRAPQSVLEKEMTAEKMVENHLRLYESIRR